MKYTKNTLQLPAPGMHIQYSYDEHDEYFLCPICQIGNVRSQHSTFSYDNEYVMKKSKKIYFHSCDLCSAKYHVNSNNTIELSVPIISSTLRKAFNTILEEMSEKH